MFSFSRNEGRMFVAFIFPVFLILVFSTTKVCGEFGVWGSSKYREGRLEVVEPLGVARSPFLTTCLALCRESHNCTALQYNVRKNCKNMLYLRYEMNINPLIESIVIAPLFFVMKRIMKDEVIDTTIRKGTIQLLLSGEQYNNR